MQKTSKHLKSWSITISTNQCARRLKSQFYQAGKNEMFFFENTVGEILKKHSFSHIIRGNHSHGGLWAVPVNIRNVYTCELVIPPLGSSLPVHTGEKRHMQNVIHVQ